MFGKRLEKRVTYTQYESRFKGITKIHVIYDAVKGYTNKNTYFLPNSYEEKENDVCGLDDHALHIHTHLNKCRHELKRCELPKKETFIILSCETNK